MHSTVLFIYYPEEYNPFHGCFGRTYTADLNTRKDILLVYSWYNVNIYLPCRCRSTWGPCPCPSLCALPYTVSGTIPLVLQHSWLWNSLGSSSCLPLEWSIPESESRQSVLKQNQSTSHLLFSDSSLNARFRIPAFLNETTLKENLVSLDIHECPSEPLGHDRV